MLSQKQINYLNNLSKSVQNMSEEEFEYEYRYYKLNQVANGDRSLEDVYERFRIPLAPPPPDTYFFSYRRTFVLRYDSTGDAHFVSVLQYYNK
jgi:hypothetical protein